MFLCTEDSVYYGLKNPILKTWASYSFLLSTILNEKTSLDWVLNYFIQFKCEENGHPFFRLLPDKSPITRHGCLNAWDICPFIDKFTINREIITMRYQKFTDFIVDSLSKKYLVYTNLNQSKLRGKEFAHPCYINGYNKVDNIIFVNDHLDHGRYVEVKCTFDEINEEYNHVDYNTADDILWLNNIYMISPKENTYVFNVPLMISFIEDYLNGVDRYEKHLEMCGNKEVSGVNVYDKLQEYLDRLCNGEEWIDNRVITIFEDHKVLMRMRIQYLIDNNYIFDCDKILNTSIEIEKLSNTALYLMLKYQITGNTSIIMRIKVIYDKIRELEVLNLESLLNKLR